MKDTEIPRAVAAAVDTAAEYGLGADDAAVLHNSNRIAVRLRPSGVLARVAPLAHRLDFEVEIARRLAGTGSPVAGLEPRAEPRVHVRDGFAVTLWTYYEPTAAPRTTRPPSTPTPWPGCTPACAASTSPHRTSPTASPTPSGWSRTPPSARTSAPRNAPC